MKMKMLAISLICKGKFKSIHKTLIFFIYTHMVGGGYWVVKFIFLVQKWMKDNKNHVTLHNPKSWSVGAKALCLWRKMETFLEVKVNVYQRPRWRRKLFWSLGN